jgi:hypothetical protein
MPRSSDFSSSQSNSKTDHAKWRRTHLDSDRAILHAVLPRPLVQSVDTDAEALGLSRAAYVAAALSLVTEFRDQIQLRVRLLERQHGVRFRSPTGSACSTKRSPPRASKVSR